MSKSEDYIFQPFKLGHIKSVSLSLTPNTLHTFNSQSILHFLKISSFFFFFRSVHRAYGSSQAGKEAKG